MQIATAAAAATVAAVAAIAHSTARGEGRTIYVGTYICWVIQSSHSLKISKSVVGTNIVSEKEIVWVCFLSYFL